jgi:cellulose synthase/poly-beta-1,6-N-acetylglucosamine synthase-like glycosyltransferase
MRSFTKRDLTLEELAYLESEMLKKRKSNEAAWGLWAGLSFFGAHRFYAESYQYAAIMLLTTLLPLSLIIWMLIYLSEPNEVLMEFSIFLLIGSVVWSWIDAFFLNNRIEELNNNIEYKILQEIIENR